jgi:hypothetical protein
MSAAPHDPSEHADRSTGQSSPAGRRRGRVLIPAVFVGGILLLFLFILLVSRLNQ